MAHKGLDNFYGFSPALLMMPKMNLKEKEPTGLYIGTKNDKNGMKGILLWIDPKSEQRASKTLAAC